MICTYTDSAPNPFHFGHMFYGQHRPFDAVDRQVDELLLSAARLSTSTALRVAVDIGCCTGERAGSLAALEIFDRIIATDIGNRKYDVANRNWWLQQKKSIRFGSNTPRPSIDFLQSDVIDLTPDFFQEKFAQANGQKEEIVFVNLRNVIQYLSPPHVCKALTNIRGLAAEGAIVAISFDGVMSGQFVDYTPLSDDPASGSGFYRLPPPGFYTLASQARYSADEIAAYMTEKLDFEILDRPTDEALRNRGSWNFEEHALCHIIARAPKPITSPHSTTPLIL